MVTEKGNTIASCEREQLEKTGYITVKEDGEIINVYESIEEEFKEKNWPLQLWPDYEGRK